MMRQIIGVVALGAESVLATPALESLWLVAGDRRAQSRAPQARRRPLLTAYLQGSMDRLYPEFKGKLRMRLPRGQ